MLTLVTSRLWREPWVLEIGSLVRDSEHHSIVLGRNSLFCDINL